MLSYGDHRILKKKNNKYTKRKFNVCGNDGVLNFEW